VPETNQSRKMVTSTWWQVNRNTGLHSIHAGCFFLGRSIELLEHCTYECHTADKVFTTMLAASTLRALFGQR
jgi:hypothetical protein